MHDLLQFTIAMCAFGLLQWHMVNDSGLFPPVVIKQEFVCESEHAPIEELPDQEGVYSNLKHISSGSERVSKGLVCRFDIIEARKGSEALLLRREQFVPTRKGDKSSTFTTYTEYTRVEDEK